MTASSLGRKSKEIEINEGSNFKVVCRNKITHGSNINWFKDKQEINESLNSRVKISWTKNSSKLSLENLLLSDTGNYSCIANSKNVDKNPSQNFQLRVLPASLTQNSDPCRQKACLNNGLCVVRKSQEGSAYCLCQENYSGEYCEKQIMWQNEDSHNVEPYKTTTKQPFYHEIPQTDHHLMMNNKQTLLPMTATQRTQNINSGSENIPQSYSVLPFCDGNANKFSPYCSIFKSNLMFKVLSISAIITLLLLAITMMTLLYRKIQSRKRRSRSKSGENLPYEEGLAPDTHIVQTKRNSPIYNFKERNNESDILNCNEMQISKFLLVDSNQICEITDNTTSPVYYHPIELKSPIKIDRKFPVSLIDMSEAAKIQDSHQHSCSSFTTSTTLQELNTLMNHVQVKDELLIKDLSLRHPKI